MSTAILTYKNIEYFISPFIFIFMSTNCFVHIFMYWYFAFPKVFLKKFKKFITISQIVQHIICICTIIWIYFILNNCDQHPIGLELGLFLYSMYLFNFVKFYIK